MEAINNRNSVLEKENGNLQTRVEELEKAVQKSAMSMVLKAIFLPSAVEIIESMIS